MKYIHSSDWHIRATAPVFRIDDFPLVPLNKVEQLVSIANANDAILLVAGDLFDSPRVSYECVNRLSDILKEAKHPVLAVAGQHDQVNHSLDMINTPYQALVNNGSIHDVTDRQAYGVYGMSWGSDITEAMEGADVIMLHHTVTEGGKEVPFFLDEGDSADEVLDCFPDAKFVVSGDYHTTHDYEVDGRILLNTGSLIRQKKNQRDHKPCCYIFDTETMEYTKIYLDIQDSEDVFKIPQEVTVDERFPEKMKELTEALGENNKAPSYEDTVFYLMNKAELSKEHKAIAKKYMRV